MKRVKHATVKPDNQKAALNAAEQKPVVPSSRVIVKNLPIDMDEQTLKKKFEQSGEVTDCRIIFKGNVNRRFAFVGFKDVSAAEAARKQFNNTFIAQSRISVDFADTKSTMPDARTSSKPAANANRKGTIGAPKTDHLDNNQASKSTELVGWKRNSPDDDGTISGGAEYDDTRLYVYNFPFNITKEDLEGVFSPFGKVTACKVIEKHGKSLGYGFISFDTEGAAIRAIADLDNRVVFGRILHLKRCLKQQEKVTTDLNQKVQNEKSSFKKIKKQRFLERMHDDTNWNSAFLNPNTVLERMADKLGLSKKALLDNEVENPAVIQAVAEKEVLDEVFEFLEKSGVNIALLKNQKSAQRSRSTMFVKHLPYTATRQGLEELFSRYGKIERMLMAPNKAIALVEFSNEEHAKNAFEMLADFVLKGTPLYLEWAPLGIFTSDSGSSHRTTALPHQAENDGTAQAGDHVAANQKTVYIKNLNYQTNEQAIEDFLAESKLFGIKSVRVVKKEGQSLGFGFVEFETREDAERMIKELQGALLDNHALKLSLAKPLQSSTKTQKPISVPEYRNVDKLVIRNVPFQATKNELSDLIKAILDFKRVRLPRKLDGSTRGFAFIEFGSVEACKQAYESLQNLHFYGRRLVVEFCNE